MKILALLSVFLALPVMAQTAKVIELSPEDAKAAKAAYEQRDAANKTIADLEKKVKTKLLQDKDGKTKDGWLAGFQYSEDFRFIVPSWSNPLIISSGSTTIPAIMPSIPSCPSTWYCNTSTCGTGSGVPIVTGSNLVYR
jgi:hypothetical protein